MHTVLITGGAGFIGQNLVHAWRAAHPSDGLVVVDAMTHAAESTVHRYLDRDAWWRDIALGAYKAWIDKNYGFRIAV